MTTKAISRIPVRRMSRQEMIEEKRRIVKGYERQYDMSSEDMTDRVDRDSIVPTIEVMTWYQTYDVLQSLLKMTHTDGTRGTITKTYTVAD